jgi:hypothetical protein
MGLNHPQKTDNRNHPHLAHARNPDGVCLYGIGPGTGPGPGSEARLQDS